MKDKLTIEQSQRLIELGIDAGRASDFEEIDVTNPNDPNQFLEMEYYRIFTLSDVLSLLPKEIEAPDYWGEVDTHSLGITTSNDVWEASYYGVNNVFRKAPELIDALYSLLVWVIENDYLNLKEK